MTSATFTTRRNGLLTNLHGGTILMTKLDGVESAPPVEENTVDVAYRDGAFPVSSRYQARTITYEGVLEQSTAAALRTSLESLKRDVSGAGYLDVMLEGEASERRYYVNAQNVVVPAAPYHLTWVPFSIVFMAYEPFGEDKTTTPLYSNAAVTGNVSFSALILGTADGNVTFRIKDMPPGNGVLEIVNVRTGERLQTRNTWRTGGSTPGESYSVLTINTAKQRVLLNGAPVDYTGTIPHFPFGTNPIQINFLPSQGDGIDAQSVLYDRNFILSDQAATGQTFNVNSSFDLGRIDVLLQRVGSPGDLSWALYKQSSFTGNVPPLYLAHSAAITGGTVPASAIAGAADWLPITFTPLAVTPVDSPYYLQLLATQPPDADNALIWKGSTDSVYDPGSRWDDGVYYGDDDGDMTFKVWKQTTLSGLNVDVLVNYKRRWL